MSISNWYQPIGTLVGSENPFLTHISTDVASCKHPCNIFWQSQLVPNFRHSFLYHVMAAWLLNSPNHSTIESQPCDSHYSIHAPCHPWSCASHSCIHCIHHIPLPPLSAGSCLVYKSLVHVCIDILNISCVSFYSTPLSQSFSAINLNADSECWTASFTTTLCSPQWKLFIPNSKFSLLEIFGQS